MVQSARLVEVLERHRLRLADTDAAVKVSGSLVRNVGLVMEAHGIHVAIGERCFIENDFGRQFAAEVVGFDGGRSLLVAEGHGDGLAVGARVTPVGRAMEIAVGPELLGRVIDGSGAPIDGKGRLGCDDRVPLFGRPVDPMKRALIDAPLDVGVRSINALFTVGRGARLGLFAGTGVGKSVLLGMMARYTSADVVVVGLIGERGREVKEFIERTLGPEGRTKAVVLAAPANESALVRLHGAYRAMAIAEYFRDRGNDVLLLMDSLTRFAMAQREIGLAVGEMPSARGYPPSVSGRIAGLVERAGNGESGRGSITAFYTVLVENDDPNDPIGDAARSILDGHLMLSRAIAERGQYPAIDVGASISRVMPTIVPPEHMARAQRFKQLYSRLEESRDMIAIGGYRAGNDAELDRAVSRRAAMENFLRQDMSTAVGLPASVSDLAHAVGE
ncbi:MAG TPA: FliI/YscN family ATPase [Stellaceae bacterium]|nr:FliI/YscN family ATPase [Stellaceae bacterium]